MSEEDYFDSDEWKRIVAHTRESTVKGMADSALVVSVVPAGEIDIKLAIETGLAVLLDKPIVVVSTGGREVSPGLRRVAHAVIEVDDIDTEAGAAELARKLKPVLQEFEADD